MATSNENKASILSELWLNYKSDEEFVEFIAYNDIGLPLAYVIDNDIVATSELAESFISETFSLLLAGLEIEDIEEGFEYLEEVFGMQEPTEVKEND